MFRPESITITMAERPWRWWRCWCWLLLIGAAAAAADDPEYNPTAQPVRLTDVFVEGTVSIGPPPGVSVQPEQSPSEIMYPQPIYMTRNDPRCVNGALLPTVLSPRINSDWQPFSYSTVVAGDWSAYGDGFGNEPVPNSRTNCFCLFGGSRPVANAYTSRAAVLVAVGSTCADVVSERALCSPAVFVYVSPTTTRETIVVYPCDPDGTYRCVATVGFHPWRRCVCERGYFGSTCASFNDTAAAQLRLAALWPTGSAVVGTLEGGATRQPLDFLYARQFEYFHPRTEPFSYYPINATSYRTCPSGVDGVYVYGSLDCDMAFARQTLLTNSSVPFVQAVFKLLYTRSADGLSVPTVFYASIIPACPSNVPAEQVTVSDAGASTRWPYKQCGVCATGFVGWDCATPVDEFVLAYSGNPVQPRLTWGGNVNTSSSPTLVSQLSVAPVPQRLVYTCLRPGDSTQVCNGGLDTQGECRPQEPGLYPHLARYSAQLGGLALSGAGGRVPNGCFCKYWDGVYVATGVGCTLPLTANDLCGGVPSLPFTDSADPSVTFTVPPCVTNNTVNCTITIGFWPYKYCWCAVGWRGVFCEERVRTMLSSMALVATRTAMFAYAPLNYTGGGGGPVAFVAYNYTQHIRRFSPTLARSQSQAVCGSDGGGHSYVAIGPTCSIVAAAVDLCANPSPSLVNTWLDLDATGQLGVDVYVDVPTCNKVGTKTCAIRGGVWPWLTCGCNDDYSGMFCEVYGGVAVTGGQRCTMSGAQICTYTGNRGKCAGPVPNATADAESRYYPSISAETYQCSCYNFVPTQTYAGFECAIVLVYDVGCSSTVQTVTDSNTAYTMVLPPCVSESTTSCSLAPGYYPWKTCVCASGYTGLFCESTI